MATNINKPITLVDSVVGLENSVDELGEVTASLSTDMVNLELDIKGGDYLLEPTSTAYTEKRYIDTDGVIQILSGSGTQMLKVMDEKYLIPSYYRGKTLQYYMYRNNSTQKTLTVAFYEADDTFISGVSDSSYNNGYYTIAIPANAAYFRYSFRQESLDTDNFKFTFLDIFGSQPQIVPMNARLSKLEKSVVYMEPLGEKDNLLVDAKIIQVNSTNDFLASPYKYNSNGKLWGINVSHKVRYQSVIDMDMYAVIRIKKSGISGRTYVLINDNPTENATLGSYAIFTEDTPVGNIMRVSGNVIQGRILRNEAEWIWLFIPTSCKDGTTYTKRQFTLLALDSYTSQSVYTSGELVIDNARSFIFEGDMKVDDDIESLVNLDRKYFTRPEKLGSQLIGKNVFVFSDSLSYFMYGMMYDWGVNIYVNAWGGARMGYEGGGGQGGESETYEDAWLCRDSYVQYVKNNVIAAGINIDYIVCTTGVNGTLSDTDETEVAYVLNNKRWYHDDLQSDPWASLSADNKARFDSIACTFAAFYSLCVAYPKAIPVIVTPYRSPAGGITVIDEDHPWTAERFAHALFYDNLLPKRNALKGIADKLGGVFVDCYTATRSSIANCPQYYAESAVHPTRIVAQDVANQIGKALNENHGMVAEDVTYN
jgi:hypothetical protein